MALESEARRKRSPDALASDPWADDQDAAYLRFLNTDHIAALPRVPFLRELHGIPADLLIPPPASGPMIPDLSEESRHYFTFLALHLTYLFMSQWPWPKGKRPRPEDVARSSDPFAHDRIYFRDIVFCDIVEEGPKRLANHLAFCKQAVLRIPALGQLMDGVWRSDRWLLPGAEGFTSARGLPQRDRKTLRGIVSAMLPVLERLSALADAAPGPRLPQAATRAKSKPSADGVVGAARPAGEAEAPLPLTPEDRDILESLASKTGETLKQEDIAAGVSRTVKTVRTRLKVLETGGYVNRPRGLRLGYCITPTGRKRLKPTTA
jgi:hypothetical protein